MGYICRFWHLPSNGVIVTIAVRDLGWKCWNFYIFETVGASTRMYNVIFDIWAVLDLAYDFRIHKVYSPLSCRRERLTRRLNTNKTNTNEEWTHSYDIAESSQLTSVASCIGTIIRSGKHGVASPITNQKHYDIVICSGQDGIHSALTKLDLTWNKTNSSQGRN